ncbi:MAG TPA: ABC transporter permease [Smithellaceae bacterium]|jgi:lipopolysaccharide transport system permease protein|nr:MAG: ABC-2 type transporter [Deltaproteobacteria bacterium ADurb.Bin022]HOG82080.1 ABC transporter permease [Smithellaceae bacterium]HOQ42327.1 ABC transporter permease [Smithellaceae bacterium]
MMNHKTSAYLPGLIWTLVRTDFKTRYHGTLGGYLWALAKPLTMFAVLYGVFSVIFTMDTFYALNLIVGLFLYDFFSEATRTGVLSLHAKAFLLTKTKFPSWVVALTSVSSALITVVIFSIAVSGYIAVFKRPLSFLQIGCFSLYVFLFLVIIMGIVLAGSVLFLRYRDMNQIWDLMLQAGFFFTPIIYPMDIVPHKFHFIMYAWMPTVVIQFSRSVLVRGDIPSLTAHLMLAGSAGIVFLTGAVLFWRLAPRSMERL